MLIKEYALYYINFSYLGGIFRFLGIAIIYLLLCIAKIQSIAQDNAKPLMPEDITKIKTFGYMNPIDLSPDGKWVAYTIKEDDKLKTIPSSRYQTFTPTGVVYYSNDGCIVLITNVESGETVNLGGDANSTSWGPSWSPDNKFLAFYSDRSGAAGLWVYDMYTKRSRQVSSAIVRPFHGYHLPQWTPDSKKVLVKILPEGFTTESAIDFFLGTEIEDSKNTLSTKPLVTVFTTQSLTQNKSKLYEAGQSTSIPLKTNIKVFGDLALIDISTGALKRLISGDIVNSFVLSPDGQQIAFTSGVAFLADNSQQILYDIKLVSILTGEKRTIARNVRLFYTGINFSWSPDGKYIAFIEWGPQSKGDVFIIPTTSGEPFNITTSEHPFFGDEFRYPIWDKNGSIYCHNNGELWKISVKDKLLSKILELPSHQILTLIYNSRDKGIWLQDQFIYLIVKNNETMKHGIIKFNASTNKFNLLFEEDKVFGNAFSYDVSSKGDHFIYRSESSEESPELWVAQNEFKNRHRLSNINPSLNNYIFGKSMLIQWKKNDSEILKGILQLPANYIQGQRYPLILFVYGGKKPSASMNKFGGVIVTMGNYILEPLLYNTRGYAIFYPDIVTNIGTPMSDIAGSVLPGIDELVSLGIVDPDKIGVIGQSYGGYTTLSLLVQSKRFKVGVMTSGYGNIMGSYGVLTKSGNSNSIGHAEEGQGKMGGNPWTYRQRYIENSPIFYLDQITAPLMIVHGTGDTNVPIFLADEVFVGMRRLNKEAVYVKYEHENHGFSNINNLLDYYHRTIDWFDKYLNPKLNR